MPKRYGTILGTGIGASVGGPAGAAGGFVLGSAADSLLGGGDDAPQAQPPPDVFAVEYNPDGTVKFDRSGGYHFQGDITDTGLALERFRLGQEAQAAKKSAANQEKLREQAFAQQNSELQRQAWLQGQYQDYLAGKMPSAAELQMQAGLAQAGRQGMAVAGSQRGYGGNLAGMRNAQLAQVGLQGQAIGDGAVLRAQEQAEARRDLGSLNQSMVDNRYRQQALADQEWQAYLHQKNYWEGRGVELESQRYKSIDDMTARTLQNQGMIAETGRANAGISQQQDAADMAFTGGVIQSGLNYAAAKKK